MHEEEEDGVLDDDRDCVDDDDDLEDGWGVSKHLISSVVASLCSISCLRPNCGEVVVEWLMW